jgi:hypothetical protein
MTEAYRLIGAGYSFGHNCGTSKFPVGSGWHFSP